jgi:hypothetical protein
MRLRKKLAFGVMKGGKNLYREFFLPCQFQVDHIAKHLIASEALLRRALDEPMATTYSETSNHILVKSTF